MATWQSSNATDSTRARIAPYAWGPGAGRYTAPGDRPPIEPPPDLGMTRLDRPGVWRVAALWWRDHQPDEGGVICSSCFQFWPCFGFRSAVTILNRIRGRMLAKDTRSRPGGPQPGMPVALPGDRLATRRELEHGRLTMSPNIDGTCQAQERWIGPGDFLGLINK